MAEPGPQPLEEALGWVGSPLADLEGEAVGEVSGVYIDARHHEPAWLVALIGGGRGRLSRAAPRTVAIPIGVCAGARGAGVWTALERAELAAAPIVDPTRALLREHEMTVLGHYGIRGELGRAGEIAGRPDGEVTAIPPRA